jgi:hypothetical protein
MGAMTDYRLYFFNEEGRIADVVQLDCRDDEHGMPVVEEDCDGRALALPRFVAAVSASMTLGQAWTDALRGKPISRRAWNDPQSRVVLAEERSDVEDTLDYGCAPARAMATRPLTPADLRADDWYVIETLH